MTIKTQFLLSGHMAMWRDPQCAANDYSSPLPSPSALLGLIGNFKGFKWGRNTLSVSTDNPMPFSPELVQWTAKNKPSIAIGVSKENLSALYYRRQDITGLRAKEDSFDYSRPIRTALICPKYIVVVSVEYDETLPDVLRNPVNRGYLGNAKMPALVSGVQPYKENKDIVWAKLTETREPMATPAYVLSLEGKSRLKRSGYWVLGNPEFEYSSEIQFTPVWKD